MHAITGITGKVKSATADALLEKRTKTALKFNHGDINMRKLTLALATLVVIAGAGVARADSSGHMSINGLSAEMPRSYDPLAPLDDGLLPPNPSQCALDQGGAMPDCPTYYWPRR
jgi:hypothetical protein